jgi:hypothetical protein
MDDKTRVPTLGVRPKHAVPAPPERLCIGPKGPASKSIQVCAPKPPDSSLGSHPAERPPQVLLTSTSSTLPQVAPAPKLRIEGSLSPMRILTLATRTHRSGVDFRTGRDRQHAGTPSHRASLRSAREGPLCQSVTLQVACRVHPLTVYSPSASRGSRRSSFFTQCSRLCPFSVHAGHATRHSLKHGRGHSTFVSGVSWVRTL